MVYLYSKFCFNSLNGFILSKRVCIIGAGPSGLPAIKNISHAGIQVVAYDYNHDVGGNWIYNESFRESNKAFRRSLGRIH